MHWTYWAVPGHLAISIWLGGHSLTVSHLKENTPLWFTLQVCIAMVDTGVQDIKGQEKGVCTELSSMGQALG